MEACDPLGQPEKRQPRTMEGGGGGDFFDLIPVFTVLKKGAAIKNIFLHCPTSPRPSESAAAKSSAGAVTPTSGGVRFLVGRHPDCHVVLDHPSVSRFHIELLARPASRKLTVTDLSSVHGTWISGKMLEPRLPVELQEGEVLKVGASTRVYVLRWVALGGTDGGSSNPLALGPLLEEEHAEEEEEGLEAAAAPVIQQQQKDANHMSVLEKPNYSQAKTAVPLCPMMPEPVVFSSIARSPSFPSSEEEEEPEHESEARKEPTRKEVTAPKEEEEGKFVEPINNQHCQKGENHKVLLDNPNSSQIVPVIPSAPLMPEYLAITSLDGSPSLYSSEEEEIAAHGTASREKTMVSKKDHGKTKVGEGSPQPFLSPPRSQDQMLSSILSRRSKSTSLLRVRTGRSREKLDGVSKVLFEREKEKEPRNEEEGDESSYPSDKENMTPKPHSSRKLKKPSSRELSALSVVRHASGSNQRTVEDKENCRPVSENGKTARTNSRLKNATQSSSSRNLKESKTYSEKENRGAAEPSSAALKVRPKKLFCEQNNLVDEEQNDETYSSDKENNTPKPPNSSITKSKEPVSSNRRRIDSAIFKRRAATERVPFQSLLDSPLTKPSTLCSSNAENSPADDDSGVRREISAGRKRERVPFLPLVERSTEKKPVDHSSGNNASSQNAKASVSKPVTVRKKKWTIVADVSCFTDEESRKALQLLEGIRGTRLIIPKMVIRELDYLKRTESLFRKPASRASAILQWIEECMVKTSWWIHVQSSGEMAPVASTPPVTPRPDLDEQLSEGMMATSFSRSTTATGFGWGRRRSSSSLAEIVSPTADDHILDCALLFRKMRPDDDEQIVLLTNSVSLKIKAMAEGLLCEMAKDFRESLVNPFSERFLWVDSSPRGPTWSLAQEAAALVESQQQHQLLLLPPSAAARRATAAVGSKTTEGAKGLKLILLHNSHYGQLNTVR